MKPSGNVRVIGGKWRGRQIKVLHHSSLRPTPDRVRETLFNWLTGHIQGAYCLDLFAGTGILGFEALSRGAKQVTFIEHYPPLIKAIHSAAIRLETDQYCEIHLADGVRWLRHEKTRKPYDIIFLDPPFASELLSMSLEVLATSPLVAAHTLIYIETAKPLTANKLPPKWQLLKEKTAGEVAYHLAQGAAP